MWTNLRYTFGHYNAQLNAFAYKMVCDRLVNYVRKDFTLVCVPESTINEIATATLSVDTNLLWTNNCFNSEMSQRLSQKTTPSLDYINACG